MRARLATPNDSAAIAQIYSEGIAERIATFETRPRTEEDVRGWFDGAHPIVVVDDEPAGVVGFASTSRYRTRECYVGIAEFAVYVARAGRRRGAAKLAMMELLSRARDAGFWKLVARVFVQNEPSRALLRGVGFREVGTYFRHAKLDGAWRDVVIVEKFLAPASAPAARPALPRSPGRAAVVEALRAGDATARMKALDDACPLLVPPAPADPELLHAAVDAFASGKGGDSNLRGRFVRFLRAYAALSPDAAREVYESLFARLREWSVGPDREAFYEIAFVIKQTLGSGGSGLRAPELREHFAELKVWLKDTIDLPHDPRSRISPANLTSLLLSLSLAACTSEDEKSEVASLVPEAMARHRVAPPASIRPPPSIPPSLPPPVPVEDPVPPRKRRTSVAKPKSSEKAPKKPRRVKPVDPGTERKH